MKEKIGITLSIVLVVAIPTFAIWLPFLLKIPDVLGIPISSGGMATVVANYDGPLYLVLAKTLYNLEQITKNYSFPLAPQYYAAHFPLFPLLIRLFAILPVGYPYSLLGVTVISSVFAGFFFYKLASSYLKKDDALWLTMLFSIFPARWLIVRSVGSPEPLFIGAIIASIYYFKNKKYFLAGLSGVLAQATKSPGILLFVAYLLVLTLPEIKRFAMSGFNRWIKTLPWKAFPIILIPASLLLVFGFYSKSFNDFFAYFHSGDNIHLMFPPFQIFNSNQPWVGTFWLEETIFVYLFGIFGFLELVKQKDYTLASFVGIYFLSILFVSHRDLVRYSLPIVPFLLISLREVLIKKESKIAFVFLLIPIYLFSLSFISNNVMPIPDWGPLL